MSNMVSTYICICTKCIDICIAVYSSQHSRFLSSSNFSWCTGQPCHLRLDLYDGGYWGDPSRISFDKAVKTAWGEFKYWLKCNHISCSQPSFKSHKGFDKQDALWKLKAYNGRVVCAWLAHCAVKLARRDPTPERLLLADCMSRPEILRNFWNFWTKSRTLPITGPQRIHELRCAASQMQTKVECAGRYLWLGLNTYEMAIMIAVWLLSEPQISAKTINTFRSRSEAVDIRNTGYKYLHYVKVLAGEALRSGTIRCV